MTEEEFQGRTAGTQEWDREDPTGYYEIDLDGDPFCRFEQTPALIDFMLLTGLANWQDGWRPKAKQALEQL